eukprot:scaffold1841_cov61-Phaeocystis_antarctica.AAC.4
MMPSTPPIMSPFSSCDTKKRCTPRSARRWSMATSFHRVYLYGLCLLSRRMRRYGAMIHSKATAVTHALMKSDCALLQPSTSETRPMWWIMSVLAGWNGSSSASASQDPID